MTEFYARLIELAQERVHGGAISERRLAQLADISQPHLHNVLKGIRTLSPQATDRLMRAMGVTIPQVLWSGEGIEAGEISAVPLLRGRIGPGATAAFEAFCGYMPFPVRLTVDLKDPLAAYLGADLSLPSAYRTGDLVLLDRNPARCEAPTSSSGWIVAENAGLRVRYVRQVRNRLEVATGPGISGGWRAISLQGGNTLDIVRARIVWIGREMETPNAGPHGTAGADD